jgi:hypothetical protein
MSIEPSPPWRGRWRLTAGVVAFVAVLALVSVVTLAPGKAGSPAAHASATSTPSPLPTAAPTPTPAPSVVLSDIFRDWSRSDLPDAAPDAFGGGTPIGVVFFKGRYVAVGGVWAGCCAAGDSPENRGLVWTSTNGISWRLHDGISAFEHASPHDVLTDGARLVVVGTYASPGPNGATEAVPAVWVSTDAVTWKRASAPVPTYVAVGAHGFVGAVAQGWVPGTDEVSTRFVTSVDGLHWSAVSGTYPVAARGIATDPAGQAVAVGVVVGVPRADGTPTTDMLAWRSNDGLSWGQPTAVLRDATPVGVTADADGFLVVGFGTQVEPGGAVDSVSRVWRLTGEGAQALPVDVDDDEVLEAAYTVGDAIVLVGDTDQDDAAHGTIWTSTDAGDRWARVPDDAAFGGTDWEISDVVSTPNGLLAVGQHWDPASEHPVPAVWLAPR